MNSVFARKRQYGGDQSQVFGTLDTYYQEDGRHYPQVFFAGFQKINHESQHQSRLAQELFQEYQVDSGEPLLGRGEKRPFRQVQKHHLSYASFDVRTVTSSRQGLKHENYLTWLHLKMKSQLFLKQK